MFSDVSVHRTFVIDRISGSHKTMRRMLVTTKDGALYMCKPSGLVRRILHVGQLTHLAHAPDEEGSPAAWVLLRVTKEHDMLFQHVAPPGTSVRHTIGEAFLDFIVTQRAKTSGAPLLVTSRPEASILHQAANLTKPPNFVKPRAQTPGGPSAPVFVPTTMDDCRILVPSDPNTSVASANSNSSSNNGGDNGITKSGTITVDAIFMELLNRAIENHLVAASHPPRIVVRPGEAYEPFQVSQKFFEAFCMAFDRDVPLVIVLQTHLPHVTTFRASNLFWKFVSRFLRVSRPPNGVLSLLSSDHIVAHVDGDEAGAVTATLLEWNDAVIAWELDVRRRNENARANPGASNNIVHVGPYGSSTPPSPTHWGPNGRRGGPESASGIIMSSAHPVVGMPSASENSGYGSSSYSFNNNNNNNGNNDGVFWRALLTELSKQSNRQDDAMEVREASLQRNRIREQAEEEKREQQEKEQEEADKRRRKESDHQNNNNQQPNNSTTSSRPKELQDYFDKLGNRSSPFDKRERVPL